MSAPASEAAESADKLRPNVESDTDQNETMITYDPTSKVPMIVVLVWICALIGLGTYAVSFFIPELSAWNK